MWDPTLVAAGLKSKDLSNVPFMQSMVKQLMLVSDETVAKMVAPEHQDMVSGYLTAIPPSLAGEHLRKINTAALAVLADHFSGQESDGVEPNLWIWVRRLIVDATTRALYGPANPFAKDPKLEGSLWCAYQPAYLLLKLAISEF